MDYIFFLFNLVILNTNAPLMNLESIDKFDQE